ncbi:hypothetical protein BHM03_00020542 [Ensete ventricosum]|nr:hypothetical protein BHM03_00020542 [Ensete ventricosum]
MGTVYTRRYVSVRHQTDTRTACYQAIPLIRVVYASWYQPREKEEEGEEEEREEKGEPRDPALLFRSRAVVEASRGDFFSPHGLLEMFVLPVQGEETSPRMGRRNKATDDAERLAAKLRRVSVADVVERMEVCTVPFSIHGNQISTIYKLKMTLYPSELYPSFSEVTLEDCKEVMKTTFVEAMEDAIAKHLDMIFKISDIKFVSGKEENNFEGVDEDDSGEHDEEMQSEFESEIDHVEADEDYLMGGGSPGFDMDIATLESPSKADSTAMSEVGKKKSKLEEKGTKKTKSKVDKKAKKPKSSKKKIRRTIYMMVEGLKFEVHYIFRSEPRILLAEVLNLQATPSQQLEREKAYDAIASFLKIPFLDEEVEGNSFPRKMGPVDSYASQQSRSATSYNEGVRFTGRCLSMVLTFPERAEDKDAECEPSNSKVDDDGESSPEEFMFKEVICGEEALKISSVEPYCLSHPIRRGHFNVSQHYPLHQVKSAKTVTLWHQSGTSTRRNTRHTNVGDLVRLCGGQPAYATIWGKRTLRCRKKSRSKERASRFSIQRNDQPFAREAPRG